MTEPFFEPLSYLDASFLALEAPSTHMHVAAVAIFEDGEISKRRAVDIDLIKAHIASKLQYIPRYRQRLAYVPYNRAPVWIDDDSFNLDYHVRHSSLPRPGNDDQLKSLAGRIMSQKLDRSKPLWEVNVVEGMSRNRFAIIAKIHHCMVDGISGVDLTTVLLGLTPTSEIEPAPSWQPRPAPSQTQLAVAEAARSARQVLDMAGSTRRAVKRGLGALGSLAERASAVRSSLESGWLTPTAKTPLNPELGPNRRFDWTEIEFGRVKAVRQALDGTVNDIVLATVAGAVGHFLHERREFDPSGIEFRAMAPVSVRKPSQRGTMGNQVAMWLVALPVGEQDPVKRLEAIRAETRHLKETNQALGASTIVELSSGTPIPLLSLANRLASSAIRPFNMTVTNIPGPQFPMYLLDAKMVGNYPIVPLWARHGIGIALFSYNGQLLWGIQADYDAVPDTSSVVESIHHSFEQLESAAKSAT